MDDIFDVEGWDDVSANDGFIGNSDAVQTSPVQDLKSMEDMDASFEDESSNDQEVSSEAKVETEDKSKESTDVEEISYKAAGKTFSVPMPTKEQVSKLLAKAHGAHLAMQEAAKERQAARKELSDAQAMKSKAGRPESFERAVTLAQKGLAREAIAELLSELPEGESLLQSFVEDELDYRRATPSERLLKDADRKARAEEIKRLRAENELNKQREALAQEAATAKEQQAVQSIRDGLQRYDLSQFIEDKEVAKELNGLLKDAVIVDLRREAKKRELNGEPELSAKDVKVLIARRAKVLANSHVKREAAAKETKKEAAVSNAQRSMKEAARGNSTPQPNKGMDQATMAKYAKDLASGKISLADIARRMSI